MPPTKLLIRTKRDAVVAVRDQVAPPLVDNSTLYPVIAAPPLVVGIDQERYPVVPETKPDNERGALATVGAIGVAFTVVEGTPTPMALTASTRNWCTWPPSKPVSDKLRRETGTCALRVHDWPLSDECSTK